MTLIIAVADETGSYIGSDSMGSNGHTGSIYKNKKVFKLGDILAGGCGSYKELQLIEKSFTPPRRFADQSASDYMYNSFAPALKHLLSDHDTLRSREGVVHNAAGVFIFIYEGVIYTWQSDLALLETVQPFETTGSGGEYAHAIMATYNNHKFPLSAEQRIKEAIKLTSRYVLSVGGPATIVKIKKENNERSKSK